MLRKLSHKLASKFSWDTRCRNADVASSLVHLPSLGDVILDAGCGENALGDFLLDGTNFGIDISPPLDQCRRKNFILGSILALPLGSESVAYAASVDVLEHLPVPAREQAIRELVRIASKGVVVACPFDGPARGIDEGFYRQLSEKGREIPEWLREHLEQPYPEIEEVAGFIVEEAESRGSKANIRIAFSEPLFTTKLLRWLAVRSSTIYVFANMVLGFFRPLVPKPTTRDNSYRVIITAQFVDGSV